MAAAKVKVISRSKRARSVLAAYYGAGFAAKIAYDEVCDRNCIEADNLLEDIAIRMQDLVPLEAVMAEDPDLELEEEGNYGIIAVALDILLKEAKRGTRGARELLEEVANRLSDGVAKIREEADE